MPSPMRALVFLVASEVLLAATGAAGVAEVDNLEGPETSPASHASTFSKLQVLLPRPRAHTSGDHTFVFGTRELKKLRSAASEAGQETMRIVEAQFVSRLPHLLANTSPSLHSFRVVLPRLDPWRGKKSWLPHRERNESYALNVDEGEIIVDAQTPWALANAMATLYQLLQIRVKHGAARITVPSCPHYVRDHPKYPHRGMMIDVSRTFYPVEWLKTLIAALSEFKLNVLHLHLTDTASWPIEIDGFPEVTEELAYKDLSGESLTYSRREIRSLVEFARRRGMMLMPEIDGPAHAPALAHLPPLRYTVAASVEFSKWSYAYEPPPGTWNISDARALHFVKKAMEQMLEDFSTSPYLHLGGDEPVAGSMCETLADPDHRLECAMQCHARNPGCEVVKEAPPGANETYWFPEVLNAQAQKYMDGVNPKDDSIPRAVWSGAVVDMGVQLPAGRSAKSVLQLWQWPSPAGPEVAAVTEADCQRYDLLQSSATYPQWTDDAERATSDYGWLYLECGSGANWVTFGPNYWCPRAAWSAMYAQDIRQGYGDGLKSRTCQDAFIGGEIALWGEITGPGNSMSLIFPRAAAWAERLWLDPLWLHWGDTKRGVPPLEYFALVLEDALARTNAVVANFDALGLGVSRLQLEFCRTHAEYCSEYTEDWHRSFSVP